MSRSAFFSGPAIPWFGDFPEVNVRLYSIDSHGRHGVVFLSLEGFAPAPSAHGRSIFGLKYRWSSMKILKKAGTLSYATRRFGNPKASSRIVVRPVDADDCSDPIAADSQIAIALSAQWAFHQRHLGRTLYCWNHHEPWRLQPAQLLEFDDGLLRAAGFGDLADRAPDSVLYAEAVDTLFAAPTVLDPLGATRT